MDGWGWIDGSMDGLMWMDRWVDGQNLRLFTALVQLFGDVKDPWKNFLVKQNLKVAVMATEAAYLLPDEYSYC